jgi:O-acetyl-ADP-ribose deacetylase (regulator of RNase III)
MSDTCFVIMPYGEKKDTDGKTIQFDEIYERMIKPAVEAVAGLKCVRCDDIEQPGWIHGRMLRHILQDRVAVVDTSTLNANVFYELGVRHALRKSATVLIHREDTSWPFNIAGLSSVAYRTTPRGLAQGKDDLRRWITNALRDPDGVDSLVYSAIPDLQVQRKPTRLTKAQVIEYPLVEHPDKSVGLVTGDREDITVGDIWVNSENTNMQMDHFYGKSTSATIRYLGARRNPKGKIEADTIGDELAQQMGSDLEIAPGMVLVTSAGALKQNKVSWIFHVAAVVGEPREGYRPVSRIDQCVKNALRRASDPEFQKAGGISILFPIFGTGQGGGDLALHGEICMNAAVEHLRTFSSNVRAVYFYVWAASDLEICQSIARKHPALAAPKS